MKTVFLFLATGFEEVEAVTTINVLRRAGISVATVSITDQHRVVGAHDIAIEADMLIADVKQADALAMVLPGGLPGANYLNESQEVKDLIFAQYKSGRTVAAICAAPIVFGSVGLSKGKRMTCYPSFEVHLPGVEYTAEPVTTDGQIVTGKGPAYAFDFALALVHHLVGEKKAQEVASGLLFER